MSSISHVCPLSLSPALLPVTGRHPGSTRFFLANHACSPLDHHSGKFGGKTKLKRSASAVRPLFLCKPYCDSSIVKGNFKTIVQLPKYVDGNEWLAVNGKNASGGFICFPPACSTGILYVLSDKNSGNLTTKDMFLAKDEISHPCADWHGK